MIFTYFEEGGSAGLFHFPKALCKPLGQGHHEAGLRRREGADARTSGGQWFVSNCLLKILCVFKSNFAAKRRNFVVFILTFL